MENPDDSNHDEETARSTNSHEDCETGAGKKRSGPEDEEYVGREADDTVETNQQRHKQTFRKTVPVSIVVGDIEEKSAPLAPSKKASSETEQTRDGSFLYLHKKTTTTEKKTQKEQQQQDDNNDDDMIDPLPPPLRRPGAERISGMGTSDDDNSELLDDEDITYYHYQQHAMNDPHDHNGDDEGCNDEWEQEANVVDGLAVAMPVTEEEQQQQQPSENIVLPSAIEYNPDDDVSLKHRPSRLIWKNRCFRLYLISFCCVLILVAVGSWAGNSLAKRNDKSSSSSSTKDEYRKSLGIREKLEKLLGDDDPFFFQDISSPYSKALHWMTLNDKAELLPTDPRFVQRYIMAYLYYATSEKQPWAFCNPSTDEEEEKEDDDNNVDSLCVQEFASSYRVNNLRRLNAPPLGKGRWLSDLEECNWAGVRCDALHQVQEIRLARANMTGTFPEGLQYLPQLQTLILEGNRLRGAISSELVGRLKHLNSVNARENLLTGLLPDGMWTNCNLHSIDVRSNRIQGSIHSSISNLADLKTLQMGDNFLTGPIPSELGLLQSASFIRLQKNFLSGTIPSSLGNMKRLEFLDLLENNLKGNLPSELALATQLGTLNLGSNKHLGGSIPEAIYLSSLARLSLHNCNFTGTISNKLSAMPSLWIFEVHNNRLQGQIPSNLARLTNLAVFSIQANNITGSIPLDLCNFRDGSLGLETLEADCLAPDNGDKPQIFCTPSCCTLCCNPIGDRCVKQQ